MTLDVVPIEALTDRAQRFRCEPLACVLSAGACADRQAAAQAHATVYRAAGDGDRGLAHSMLSCVACSLGARVTARIPAAEPVLAAGGVRVRPACVVRGCDDRAGRVGPRTPPAYSDLCARHRTLAATIRTRRRVTHAEAAAALRGAP